jgi:hypothetical protein
VVEMGFHFKPTIGSTTPGDVKDFFKNMKELKRIFDEVDSHFKDFIIDLMNMVPSISFVTPYVTSLYKG